MFSGDGPSGELRCGYMLAATLGAFKIRARDGQTARVKVASVTVVNQFWYEQGPHTVALRMGNRFMVWPKDRVEQISDREWVVSGPPAREIAP